MKPSEVIDIYEDYQEETKPLGKALIIEEKPEGLTFILDEMPKDKQIVYGTKRFLCEVTESNHYPVGFRRIFNKRYIHTIGALTFNTFEDEDDESAYPILDDFLRVDDTEMF